MDDQDTPHRDSSHKADSQALGRREFLIGAGMAGMVLTVTGPAFGAKWPTKPINIVIMYAAGGGTDVVLRVVAQEMAKSQGWTVEPTNRPGAVGAIATEYVLRQPADGYTLLGAANYNKFVRVMGHTKSKLWEDWSILQGGNSLASWSVPQNSKFKTLDDAIAFAKENPGRLTVSTSGTGGIWHEVGLLMADKMGIEVRFVPYKGGKPATLAGLQGETLIAGGGVHEHVDLIRDGQLRNLFQTGSKDITLKEGQKLPSIGSLVPATKPMLPAGGVYNLMMRRSVPVEVQKQIAAAFTAAINSEAFGKVAERQFFEIAIVTGEAADKKGAYLETLTADIFNRHQKAIGAKVMSLKDLGLPEPDQFDAWWPPKGYKSVDV